MEKRIKNIFNNIEKKPDVILIKNSDEPYIDDNFFYVTGLTHGLFEGSVAVLFQDGSIDLIVSELESEIAKKAKAGIKIYRSEEDFDKILKDSISSSSVVGLNFEGISQKEFCKLKEKLSGIEFIDVSKSFEKTRLVKDELEINSIKKACTIADKVMENIPEFLNEGMYEYELAAEINYLMQKNGADKPAFETISSFGKSTAEPHYTHGDVAVKNGDLVLCDFGACFKKYNSDITRTFVFGKASADHKEMYETVLDAQQIGFETAKAGVNANEVHHAVESYIDDTKFKGRFIHSTGHSLGLAVHDGGARFSDANKFELKENMVFTIEPGVYLPGYGGVRIEDVILIKKSEVEILTKTSRELIQI